MRRASQPSPRATAATSSSSNGGHAGAAPRFAASSVHDPVAAVLEDDEERADPVVRRAPEAVDAEHRRTVAEHGDDGSCRQRHAQADSRREPAAEPAHRRAHESQRAPRGNSLVISTWFEGHSSTRTRSSRRSLAQRLEDVAGHERRGGRRRLGSPEERPGGGLSWRKVLGQRRDDLRGRAEHSELHGTAMSLVGVVGHDRERRPCDGERPRVVGALAKDGRSDREHDVERRERLTQPRPVERAANPPTADDPAGSPPDRRRPPGRRGSRAARQASTSAAHFSSVSMRRRADHERRALAAPEELGERVDGRLVPARARAGPPRGRRPRAPRPPAATSRPSARSRPPARGASPPRGRRARSRPARPAPRNGCSNQTGYSPASPCSFPAGTARQRGDAGPAGRR